MGAIGLGTGIGRGRGIGIGVGIGIGIGVGVGIGVDVGIGIGIGIDIFLCRFLRTCEPQALVHTLERSEFWGVRDHWSEFQHKHTK